MSYRKIEVNGNTYEYVIGRSVIKIKDVGIFPIAEYGNPIGYPLNTCDGYKFQHVLRSHKANDYAYNVTPKIIAGIISGKKVEPMQLMVNPYQAEISDRIMYLKYDPETYNMLKDEI